MFTVLHQDELQRTEKVVWPSPPHQRYWRLLSRLTQGQQTPTTHSAALRDLAHYLKYDCTSPAERDHFKQFCTTLSREEKRKPAASNASGSAVVAEGEEAASTPPSVVYPLSSEEDHAIDSRANALATRAAKQREDEQNRWMMNVAAGGRSSRQPNESDTPDSSLQPKILNGIPAEGNLFVDVWTLTTPASSRAGDGSKLSEAAEAPSTPLTNPFMCLPNKLTMHTLGPAYESVASYLTTIRALAEVGKAPEVSDVVWDGMKHLRTVFQGHDARVVFGVLELRRHQAVLLNSSAGSHRDTYRLLQQAVPNTTLQPAVQFFKFVEKELSQYKGPQLATAPASRLVELRDACAALILEYSMTFHLILSFHEGLAGDFASWGAALNPRDGAVYGAVRYPEIRDVIFAKNPAGELVQRTGTDAISGRDCVTFPLASSSLWNPSQVVMPTATATTLPFIASFLSFTLAPIPAAMTFMLLSAVAGLPLRLVLNTFVTVGDVQVMVSGVAELATLVKALWRGNLGEALKAADSALAQYMMSEPWADAEVCAALRHKVRVSLAFQYAMARRSVDLRVAATEFGMDGPTELVAIYRELIREGKLSARVDVVHYELHQVISTAAVNAEAGMTRVLESSTANSAALSLRLRLLTVQRNLVTPSAHSVGGDVLDAYVSFYNSLNYRKETGSHRKKGRDNYMGEFSND